MEWSFDLSKSPEFIRVTISGVFCSTQYAEMFDELFALRYWRFGTPLLFDNRKLNHSGIDPVELMDAADNFVSRNPELAFSPIAVLLENSEALELGERFGQITDHRSLADVKRFLNESDAIEWLTS